MDILDSSHKAILYRNKKKQIFTSVSEIGFQQFKLIDNRLETVNSISTNRDTAECAA